MRRNPSTDTEEEQIGSIHRRIQASREELAPGRGRFERRLGSPIGRKAAVGSTRSVLDVFLAESAPDLPSLRTDIRRGAVSVPAPHVSARLASAEDKLRKLRTELSRSDVDPTDEEVGMMIDLSEKISAMYAEQAAEAQARLDASRPATSPEGRKVKFIKQIRLFLADALMHVAPSIDQLQLDLDHPPLTRKERHAMSDMAMRLRSVAGGANAELKGFIHSHESDMRDEEKKRITDASDWLALSAQSLASVPTIVDYLNMREVETGVGLPAAVREILVAMRNTGDTEEEEDEVVEDTTDEHAFAALSGGVRGMKRAWDKLVSASSFVTSEMAVRESERSSSEMTPNGGRFPMCTDDI